MDQHVIIILMIVHQVHVKMVVLAQTWSMISNVIVLELALMEQNVKLILMIAYQVHVKTEGPAQMELMVKSFLLFSFLFENIK